jgi:uncharacterized protein
VSDELEVVEVPEAGRWEARRGGEVLAWAEYSRAGKRLVVTHTEVDPAYEGEGIGGRLVRSMLDAVSAGEPETEIVPICPFMAGWIMRHPEYAPMVTPALRGQFEEKQRPATFDDLDV